MRLHSPELVIDSVSVIGHWWITNDPDEDPIGELLLFVNGEATFSNNDFETHGYWVFYDEVLFITISDFEHKFVRVPVTGLW